MLVSPLCCLPIPEPYAGVINYDLVQVDTYREATEVLAFLRGEEVANFNLDVEKWCPGVSVFLGPTLSLRTNDGQVVEYCKESLRRRFHFIDDFLSTFPDTNGIGLPFDYETISFLVSGERLGPLCIRSGPGAVRAMFRRVQDAFRDGAPFASLANHDACLSYLNPKSALEYFSLSTIGTRPERLVELHSLLTESERVGILDAHSLRVEVPLPRRGLGLGSVMPILMWHKDSANLISLFSEDYPSHTYLALSQIESKEAHVALLDWTFKPIVIEQHCGLLRDQVILQTFSLASKEKRWEKVQRALTMLGITNEHCGNKDKKVPFIFPTNAVMSTGVLRDEWQLRMDLAKNMVKLAPPELSLTGELANQILCDTSYMVFMKA